MNLRGKTMYLCQHNLKTMVPVLQSTAGYGLLFDAGCAMIYEDRIGQDGKSEMTMQMESANEVGVTLKQGYNGDLTSKQAGSIGGQMVKKMIESYENSVKQLN